MSSTINITANTDVVLVPTVQNQPFIVYLPNTNTLINQVITVRDGDGYASQGNPIVISTLSGAYIAGATIENSITTPYGFITYQTASNGSYTPITSFQSYTSHPLANVSNFFTPTIQLNDLNTPNQTNTMIISSQSLYVNSTIRGQVTDSNLTSTIQSLGSFGYISSLSTATERLLQSTVRGFQNIFSTGTLITNTLTTNASRPFTIYYSTNFTTLSTLTLAGGGALTSSSIQYSYDGSNWKAIASGGFQYGCQGIGKINNYWIATGQYDGGNSKIGSIQKSFNGSNWSNNTSGGLGGKCVCQNYTIGNTSPYALVGGGVGGVTLGSIQYSSDGVTWNSNVSGGFINGCSALAWNGSYFLAGGNDVTNVNSTIQYSTDGSNWTPVGGTYDFVNSLTWNGSYWLAAGKPGGIRPQLSIQYSRNGINWLPIQSGGFRVANATAWNGSMWVAVGSNTLVPNTNIQYSYDGLNWSNSVSGTFYTSTNTVTQGFDIVWNTEQSLWIAIGEDPTSPLSTIKYSNNGSNWFNSASGPGFTGGGINRGFTLARSIYNYPSDIYLSSLQMNFSGQPYSIVNPPPHKLFTISTTTTSIDSILYINSSTNTVGINASYSYQSSLVIEGNTSFYSTLSLSSIQSIQTISSIPGSAVSSLYKPFFYNPTDNNIGYYF
jgi:hypothetical protein